MPSSPRLALPFLQPSQAQKHVTHNEALQVLDAAVQLRVHSFGTLAPPASPGSADVHAVGAGATGAWAGQDGRLAAWDGTSWLFVTPREGWQAWGIVEGAYRRFVGGAWVPNLPDLQNLPGVGVNAAWDAANRLAVSAAATLLTHEGAGHQVKVNKAGALDTASLLFQSGFSGHAELGLAGSLDLSLKVRDAGAWSEALSVARATGRVTLPQGATVNGPVTGSAVQSGPLDATAGRLLTVGAYGLGGNLPVVGNAGVVDGSLVSGLYCYDTGQSSSGGPAGVVRGALLHTRRTSGGGETQLLVVEAGSAAANVGQAWSRSRVNAAWTAWACGPVATSNANGRSVRHGDGTQVCWHTLTTVATGETTWTFPQAFSTATGLTVTATVASAAVQLLAPRHAAKVAASVGLSVIDATPARVAASLDVCAVGRWY